MSDIHDTGDNHRPLDQDPDAYDDAVTPTEAWDGEPTPGVHIGNVSPF